MNILILGDVSGPSGLKSVTKNLPGLIKKKKINFVVINGEKRILSAQGRHIGDFGDDANTNLLETIAIAYGLQITNEVCKLNNLSPIVVRVCSDCKTVVQFLNDEVEIRNPETDTNSLLKVVDKDKLNGSEIEFRIFSFRLFKT